MRHAFPNCPYEYHSRRDTNAVCLLLKGQPQGKGQPGNAEGCVQKQPAAPEEKPPPERIWLTDKKLPERVQLALPRRHSNNSRAIAYLLSRGIDKELILGCIDCGILYESAYRHVIIFRGKDESGKTRYAAIHSTTTK